MSNHKVIFLSSEDSGISNELEVYYNVRNEVTVSLKETEQFYPVLVSLDKPTAIKLVKVLKSEISKIEEEVSNG
jgi:hypothetical protein|tara:strand:+ start:351 stop:572 length:222 start_codon:yes stop_codon:yes gene_type:complete